MRSGQEAEAHSLFVVLLRRIESLNRRWLAGVLLSLPTSAPERREWTQDLAQELTLLLWKEISLRDNDAWELFFQRALAYAQSHVASTYLQRQGLRVNPRAKRPERGPALAFSRLLDQPDQRDNGDEIADDVSVTLFARADLADLRALVARLPSRERLAVVMRYWQQAPEAEIAEALGGVTTRAVRYILRRAYGRLRAWYAGEETEQLDIEEVADAY
jgi:RNA polymerase sigma factor (sigma-70 family)